ncbi:MAG: monovalent cation/H(+) antiporter subunit G [Ilumatobacter sp.]|nr:MAG: monovalent cation/H(+) antiporter subunit G [Ilumatobacter sp.]
MTLVAGILIVLGATFTMLAGVGALRFSDVYARMHPAAKGPTLGLLLVAVGAAIELRSLAAVLALGLVVILQFLAAPVGAHLLGRAIHQRLPLQLDEVDELARDLAERDHRRDV